MTATELHDCEQGSELWAQARCGLVTASRCGDATAMTRKAIANCVKAETVSACSALSVLALICSYFAMCPSTAAVLSCSPVNFLSTCAMVLSSERQNGMNPSRILCRVS